MIRRWRLDRFVDDEVKVKYRDALRAGVNGFSESIKHRVENGRNSGHSLEGEQRVWISVLRSDAGGSVLLYI